MSIIECDIRSDAIIQLFERGGIPRPMVTSWESLRKEVRKKDKSVKFSPEVLTRTHS